MQVSCRRVRSTMHSGVGGQTGSAQIWYTIHQQLRVPDLPPDVSLTDWAPCPQVTLVIMRPVVSTAQSMIMLGSVQDATTSAWLTNVRLLVADCLSRRHMIIASKARPSWHGHVYLSIVCRDYKTRTEHVTVVYFIYELLKNMQILKRKLPTLWHSTHIHVNATYQLTRSHFGRLLLSQAQLWFTYLLSDIQLREVARCVPVCICKQQTLRQS